MRASTKRILSVGFAALFFIGTVVVYTSLIQPESAVITEKRALVASKENLFNNQKQAIEQVQNIISQFRNVEALRETTSLAVPDGPQTVGALRQVEAIARVSGVTVSALAFKVVALRPATDQSFIKKLGTVEVDVSVTGAYNDVKQFLRFLETSVRVANVKAVKFQPAGARGGPDTLNVNAEMFYQQ